MFRWRRLLPPLAIKLDFSAPLCFNSGVMRTLATLTLAVFASLSLSSCGGGGSPWGGCNCSGYNPDYLRDVPVTRSQRFE